MMCQMTKYAKKRFLVAVFVFVVLVVVSVVWLTFLAGSKKCSSFKEPSHNCIIRCPGGSEPDNLLCTMQLTPGSAIGSLATECCFFNVEKSQRKQGSKYAQKRYHQTD